MLLTLSLRRKPENTDEHFSVTTEEPYGVCCIEGLKVSMLMVSWDSRAGYSVIYNSSNIWRSISSARNGLMSENSKVTEWALLTT